MNKPFLKAGYIGLLLIAVSIVLLFVNPSKGVKLPQGFVTPVVAFEFISSTAEVYDLFGYTLADFNGEMVVKMRAGTLIDFFYMLVYTIFLCYICLACNRITGEKWFFLSGVIAILICLSDYGENVQLLSIMSKLSSGNFENEVGLLHYFTWAKWGGLSAVFISFIPFLRKSGFMGRVISLVSLISALAGSAAYIHRSVLNELYVLSIALIFIMLITFSFTFKYPPETVNQARN